MRAVSLVRALPVLAAGGFALTLGGCTGVTYGTGTRAELQTLEDVTSIASFGAKKKEDIEYKPRGGIVVPPNANLPPPTDEKKVAAAGDNWPVDQDVMARKIKAERTAKGVDATATPGQDPGFRLPKGAKDAPPATGDKEGFKQMAAAKAGQAGTYDANGKPVRRFLTEPPSTYREADPTAPVGEPTEKKKKKWWPFGS